MIKEKYKQLCLAHRFGGISTIRYTHTLAPIFKKMSSQIYLQDILPLEELKNEGVVLLARHSHEKLDEIKQNNLIEDYQSFQNRPAFRKSRYLVSFLGIEKNRAIFYGIYEVIKIIENNAISKNKFKKVEKYLPPESIETDFQLELKKIEEFDKYRYRLVIDWIVPRGWFNTYGKVKDKPVFKILPPYFIKDFPGLMNINLNFYELKTIIENPDSHEDWYNTLSQIQAVYLILYNKTGHQYVGVSYGEKGLWQRWDTYVKTLGTGGNKELEKIKKKDPRFHESLNFSILEVLSKTATPKECIIIEKKWKNKLGSRAFGLNEN
jgi:hypothetical protein